ncbi:MAG: threonine synthase [Candidatus Omnitrophota bacterium]
MSYLKCLKSKGSGQEYPLEPIYVCEYDFSPLEADYDYDGLKKVMTRERIEKGPRSLWRYRDLLPIQGEPTVGLHSGFTPLVRSKRLAEELGVRELYIKDDSVCHPTWSFKDRVVAVALTRAKEFGFDTVACASTGNLANAVSAHGARAGLNRYIFIPHDLEKGKVIGSLVYQPHVVAVRGAYDEVNRLCSEIVAKYHWGFVNVNLRPYYSEGSKTIGYEIMEQLGWRAPAHIVVPAASGSLITKIWKALKEFEKLELLESEVRTKIHCAQPQGCSPIATAILEKAEHVLPVKARTIAKSLAIGNPADGYYAKDVVQTSGGTAGIVSDDEIREGIKLLACTEGIFTETAGGVTVATAKKLIERGDIPKDEAIVLAITGNGLKTQEAIQDAVGAPVTIDPSLKSFEEKVKPSQGALKR